MKMSLSKTAVILSIFLISPLQSSFATEAMPPYGSQLMTQQERIEHRNRLQELNTVEERNRYLLQHHILMQERAKKLGIELPDRPMDGMGIHKKNNMPGSGKKGGGRN